MQVRTIVRHRAVDEVVAPESVVTGYGIAILVGRDGFDRAAVLERDCLVLGVVRTRPVRADRHLAAGRHRDVAVVGIRYADVLGSRHHQATRRQP